MKAEALADAPHLHNRRHWLGPAHRQRFGHPLHLEQGHELTAHDTAECETVHLFEHVLTRDDAKSTTEFPMRKWRRQPADPLGERRTPPNTQTPHTSVEGQLQSVMQYPSREGWRTKQMLHNVSCMTTKFL